MGAHIFSVSYCYNNNNKVRYQKMYIDVLDSEQNKDWLVLQYFFFFIIDDFFPRKTLFKIKTDNSAQILTVYSFSGGKFSTDGNCGVTTLIKLTLRAQYREKTKG